MDDIRAGLIGDTVCSANRLLASALLIGLTENHMLNQQIANSLRDTKRCAAAVYIDGRATAILEALYPATRG